MDEWFGVDAENAKVVWAERTGWAEAIDKSNGLGANALGIGRHFSGPI